jgi:hypothetical protein
MVKTVKVLSIKNDFMDNTIRMFKWIGWSLIDQRDPSSNLEKIVYVGRLAYLFTMNFLILFGFVLEAMYCVSQIGQPKALVNITNTAVIMGNTD